MSMTRIVNNSNVISQSLSFISKCHTKTLLLNPRKWTPLEKVHSAKITSLKWTVEKKMVKL